MTLGQAHVDLTKILTVFLPSDITLGQAHVNLDQKKAQTETGMKKTI
jgi:hypothetical protein